MFLTPQINECKNCSTLKDLLHQIDCSLFHLIRNEWNNEKYNVENYFSLAHFNALVHYKRIVTNKIYNSSYTGERAQDIISQVERILYGDPDCSRCHDCDTPPGVDTTTTTTTTSTTSTTSSSTTSSSTTIL